MYLLTLPEPPASVTLTGVADTSNIYDSDLETFVDTSNRSPALVLDLGSAKVIDALFLKGANLQDFILAGSNDNSSYTDLGVTQTAPAHGNAFYPFANTTAYRYYRITFSTRQTSDPNYRVHEVYLMRLLLNMDNDQDRPRINNAELPGDHVVAYSAYNDDVIEYRLQGARAKARLTFGWGHLDEAVAQSLVALYAGDIPAPELTVYPRPVPEPSKIYRAKWVSDVHFSPSEVKTTENMNGDVTASFLMRGQIQMEEL